MHLFSYQFMILITKPIFHFYPIKKKNPITLSKPVLHKNFQLSQITESILCLSIVISGWLYITNHRIYIVVIICYIGMILLLTT